LGDKSTTDMPMRAFLTGGTGFVGGAVARALRGRGDEVTALVRDPSRADALRAIGCELVVGELPGTDLAPLLRGADALFHVGGQYRVGVPPRDRPAMHRANVAATEAALAAGEAAGVRRIVYISTVGVAGDTGGRVVDETYRRPKGTYLSYYDETKHVAHERALAAARRGVPVVIAMPSQVYGPGDHSGIGDIMRQAAAGSLRAVVLPGAGVCMVHVDDLADGILRVHDRGEIGTAYVLAGECLRLAQIVERAAAAGGRRAPRLTVPTGLLRAMAPLVDGVTRLVGRETNLRETVRTGDNVTFWATADRARRELGWEPRALDAGLRETLAG
jgi:dihydroflavonol-4-reductase